MKKFAPFITILLIVTVIVLLFLSLGKQQQMVVIKEGNIKMQPLQVFLNK